MGGVHGVNSFLDITKRLLRRKDHRGIETAFGAFNPEGVYSVIQGLYKPLNGKAYNVTFSTPDISHWDRAVLSKEIRDRIQFLVIDLLGNVVRMTPMMDEHMRAIQLLSIQA